MPPVSKFLDYIGTAAMFGVIAATIFLWLFAGWRRDSAQSVIHAAAGRGYLPPFNATAKLTDTEWIYFAACSHSPIRSREQICQGAFVGQETGRGRVVNGPCGLRDSSLQLSSALLSWASANGLSKSNLNASLIAGRLERTYSPDVLIRTSIEKTWLGRRFDGEPIHGLKDAAYFHFNQGPEQLTNEQIFRLVLCAEAPAAPACPHGFSNDRINRVKLKYEERSP
jgi:hypothetical protein